MATKDVHPVLAAKDDSSDRQNIQVIARASAILHVLKEHPDGLSLGAIAKLVELPRSTVQRIVDALDRESLVIAAAGTSGVRLGPALIALAAATQFEIVDIARPLMTVLSKQLGETVDLSILDQDKVVFVHQVAGTHRLTALSAIGIGFPLHCSANGKALLAELDDADLNKLKKKIKLTKETKNSIQTWDRLEKELSQIRNTHVAYDWEEHSMGICAISIALRTPAGELAAISVPVPTQRFEPNRLKITTKLLESRDALRQRLSR